MATTRFGIICLTPDNLAAPWILFEAGALSKSLKDSQVCTLLLGQLKPADVKGPLAGFQHTIFNREDFKKLVFTINGEMEHGPLSDTVVTRVFDKWWPDLETNISQIVKSSSLQAASVERPEGDILKEILELSRYIARNTSASSPQDESDLEKLRMLLHLPLEELDLGKTTLEELAALKIRLLKDLCTRTDSELMKAGFSPAKLKNISDRLEALGLCLGMTFEKIALQPPRKFKRV